MSQNAVRFLVDLSQDPVRMEDFWHDPESFFEAAGLTLEERDVIRSGDSGRLQALLGRYVPLLFSQTPKPPPPPPPPPPRRRPKPETAPAAPKPKPKPRPKPKAKAARPKDHRRTRR